MTIVKKEIKTERKKERKKERKNERKKERTIEYLTYPHNSFRLLERTTCGSIARYIDFKIDGQIDNQIVNSWVWRTQYILRFISFGLFFMELQLMKALVIPSGNLSHAVCDMA